MIGKTFAEIANYVAVAAGKPLTFISSCFLILVWAASGPIFGFSDTWQLIINTSTTIITFLMVFLIQNTQNRDGAAIQAKLDELIRASAAQNTYIGIEQLTEEELSDLRQRCEARANSSLQTQAREAADVAEQEANVKARRASLRAVDDDPS